MNILLIGSVLLILIVLLRRDQVIRFKMDHLAKGDLDGQPDPIIPKRLSDGINALFDSPLLAFVALMLIALLLIAAFTVDLNMALFPDRWRNTTPTTCATNSVASHSSATGGQR